MVMGKAAIPDDEIQAVGIVVDEIADEEIRSRPPILRSMGPVVLPKEEVLSINKH